MDTSRQNSAEEQKNSRMTSNPANTYENSYHQKPPSFNHKQVNISLVDDGSNNPKKQQKTNKNEKQESGSNEWRESIPIKLEHFLFNFKENSLKVYKAPKIMLISAILACLLFCGVLALILSQRDDLKKEANLPLDQSAIAERIIGESLLSHHKLKNSLFEQKNQTGLGERSRKNYHSAKSNDASAKDAAVRKAFGSLLFSGDDEIEPDPEENNSDESFDGERSRSRTNFNLFLSDNERQSNVDEQKDKSPAINDQQNENPRVMFIERLMGFGMQPKFGLSESLVIRKTIGGDENISTSDDQTPSSNKIKESKIKSEEDPTFLLKYAAAAMLSRILATAQQQAYMQQVQQQRFREMNEKNILSNHPPPYYRGYRMMREQPAESALMYGRPMHQSHKPHYHPQSRLLPPFQTAPAGQFVSSDRGFSRGPLLSNEEAESQQVHPIILMLNVPYKDQTPAAAHLMGQGQVAAFAQPTIETPIQPIFMPYAPNSPLPRQNPYYKPTRDQQHPVYSPPFAHHKNHNYYPQQSVNEGYYTHPYSIPMNRGSANGPVSPHQQRYNNRMANTIEVPIEIHQVSPPILPSQSHHAVTHQPTAQIIVQPQLLENPQPNENDQDQSNENEHHMVVFYDSSDNMSHSEENNSNNIPQQPPTFVKENKPLNNNLEKTNQQMGKMLLLHFVNPNNNVTPQTMNQPPQIVDSMPPEQQQSPQLRKPFLIQQEQPVIEKQQQPINNQDNQNKQKPEIIKNEEEASPANDQINREEVFEKTTVSDNQNESENEPASLAHFAQVIRHVIDQQHQNQEQRPPQQIQPVIAQQKPVSSVSQQQSSQNQQTSTSPTIQQFNQPRKDIQTENSNKEISQIEKSESIQESIQSPAFAMLVENDEN